MKERYLRRKHIIIFVVVMCAAYGVYLIIRGFSPPYIAEGHISSDWSPNGDEVARKFTAILQRRFPVGTSEASVVAVLRGQGFANIDNPSTCPPLTEEMWLHTPRNYITCPFYNPKRSLF